MSMTNASPLAAVNVAVIESKPIDDKPKPYSLAACCSARWKAILAEFVSTSMLVFFGCMSCIPIDGLTEQNPFYSPVGFGLTVLFNIQIFGHISMAHMNPAVTLAGVIWGNSSPVLGVFYFVAQVLGAAVGYCVLVGVAPIDLAVDGICVTQPHRGLTSIQTLGIEILLTSALSLLICGVWDPVNQHKQDSVPVKFGLAVIGLSAMGGPLTGASMNSARSFGPALWTGIWNEHWTYWVGPFIGGAVTTILYKLIFLQRGKNLIINEIN